MRHFLFLSFVIVLLGCQEKATTPSMYEYQFDLDVEGNTPQIGDEVVFHETTFLNGKEMFATYSFGPKIIILPPPDLLTKPLPPNYEMLFNMSPGDSATVWQPLLEMKNLPKGYDQKDVISYKIKLLKVTPASEFSGGEKKNKVGITPTGYKYTFLEKTKNPKAQIGDRIRYRELRFKNDSLIYRTGRNKLSEVFLPPKEELPPVPPGNYSALTLMSVGDSIYLSQPLTNVEALPKYLSAGDTLNYVIKVLEISTPGEMLAEATILEATERAKKEKTIAKEKEILAQTKANIEKYNRGGFGKELLQRPSGLKYIIHHAGTGERRLYRQDVKVHYAGFLMDGTSFDNSFKTGEPIVFPLGMGKVIPGWDEAIALLDVGTEATLFIPYTLAYGEAGSPPRIPQRADLAFYVEILP